MNFVPRAEKGLGIQWGAGYSLNLNSVYCLSCSQTWPAVLEQEFPVGKVGWGYRLWNL